MFWHWASTTAGSSMMMLTTADITSSAARGRDTREEAGICWGRANTHRAHRPSCLGCAGLHSCSSAMSAAVSAYVAGYTSTTAREDGTIKAAKIKAVKSIFRSIGRDCFDHTVLSGALLWYRNSALNQRYDPFTE